MLWEPSELPRLSAAFRPSGRALPKSPSQRRSVVKGGGGDHHPHDEVEKSISHDATWGFVDNGAENGQAAHQKPSNGSISSDELRNLVSI
ncbi:hypothetical protein ZHAS_00019938 [Anopheles sinensis]|uniref:Uncharacterized protein n=1 Tax=Anopheles sinensis TaxID=74873 RepID=A0A084WNJ2_ANOSI|nr:hypothetical protein ZHAS_00019938 [Anopheles sinensis]